MEGLRPSAASRLADYKRNHPETQIDPPVNGVHYAWTPTPDGGELTYGCTAKELADKLGA